MQTFSKTSTLSADEKLSRLRLIRTENVGPVTYRHLLGRFGTAANALAELPALAKKGGRKKPLKAYPKNKAEEEIEKLSALGGTFLYLGDKDYPEALLHIDDAPPVLAVLGHSHLLHERCIGVVGGRNASLNGRKLTKRFAEVLGERGFVITSGMARGIDTAAHDGSLATGSIAVLAGGVDVIYPKENIQLYEELKERGAIISEMPFGATPQARHFPRRNRLISGLAEGLLVIEAALKSGSLISARFANEQGREVFAVPGSPMDSRSRGCNDLIRQGAGLAETPDDIIDALNRNRHTLNESENLSQYEIAFHTVSEDALESRRDDLLKILSHDPTPVDSLARALDMSIAEILCLVVELELAGQILRQSGNQISLIANNEYF